MYKFEVQKAADELVKTIFGVKPQETVVITTDSLSNEAVVNAVAASVHAAGAFPLVLTIAAPKGVGKAADPEIPVEALTGALLSADVWIELNQQWLLYSTPFERVQAENKKLRYMCLVEFNEDLMVRTIGRVDTKTLQAFMQRVAQKTREATTMRVTTKAGTDVAFAIEPTHLVSCDCGDATGPGIHMLTGQINVVPRFGSVNGTIVFDGCITPPFGQVPSQPVVLTVKDGVLTEITGGREAVEFEAWLKSFDDANMFKMAHIAYGFNPGAKLTGNIVEDERVWGATEWGIGYVSPYDAPPVGLDAKSHCDGICLNSTVWLDDQLIMEDGVIVDEELKKLQPQR